MGQKVHPYGFRLGFNKTWKSRWFADKDYASLLHEDLALKRDLKKRFQHAGVAKIEIERAANKLKIDVHTSRPGIIIGRKGQEVDKLKQEIQKRTNREVFINIQEIQKPELDAQLISESVAMQLEKRVAFRRAMRKAVESALRSGCRAGSTARRSRAPSGTCTDSSRCRRCARTSITALPRRIPRTGKSASRCGSTRASA
jgi:small subunit ribosomal protein S3